MFAAALLGCGPQPTTTGFMPHPQVQNSFLSPSNSPASPHSVAAQGSQADREGT